MCWLQIGKAVFDPLLESSETVYLGIADGQSWSSFEQSDDGGHESDPTDDMEHFSQLWRTWSSTVEQGKHSYVYCVIAYMYIYVHVHIGSYMCTCMHTLLVHLS